jgi:hypothetical protein
MRLILFSVVTTLIISPAIAAGFAPAIEQVCKPKPVKAGERGEVDRKMLLGQLLSGISDIQLDTEGGDLTFPNKRDAIINPVLFCQSRSCGKGIEDKLAGLRTDLIEFFRANSMPVAPDKGGFEIRRTGGQMTGEIVPGEFFGDSFSGISAVCVAAVKKEANGLGKKQGEKDNGRPAITERLMVRKSVTDLRVSQSQKDKFKALDRAAFSVTDDYLKNTQSYNIDGVAGYALTNVPFANGYGEFIGFGSYTRQFVTGTVPKGSANVHNMSFGLLDNIVYDWGGERHNLQLFSQILHSEVSYATLLTGNVIYSPLTGRWIGEPGYIGTFAFQFSPQIKYVYGHVLEAGFDPNFIAQKEYNRVGSRIELLVVDDGGMFNGFSLRTAYEYLRVLSGPLQTVERLESTLSYKFPDQEFWSIDLKYVNGRNLDTLELQKMLTVGVGFKY